MRQTDMRMFHRLVRRSILTVALLIVASSCGGDAAEAPIADGSADAPAAPEPTNVPNEAADDDRRIIEDQPQPVPTIDAGQPVLSLGDPIDVVQGDWRLVELRRNGNRLDLWPDADITFQVNATDVGGNAACNSWGGRADFGGDQRVAFPELFFTEMACEPPLMEAEQQFLDALATVDAWRAGDDQLELTGPGVSLRFERDGRPEDVALGSVTWRLNGIIVGGDAVSFSPDMGGVTMTVAPDTLQVVAPCWTLAAPVTVEPGGEGNMTVDGFADDPKISCAETPHLDTMLDVLRRTDAYLVFEDNLRLIGGGLDLAHFVAA